MCLVIQPGTGIVINIVARPTKALREELSVGNAGKDTQVHLPPAEKLVQEDHAERDLQRRFEH